MPRRNRPIEIGDLDHEIPGPDARFQSHGPGCGCGDLECPWYKGEVARRNFQALTPMQKANVEADVRDAMRGYYPGQP